MLKFKKFLEATEPGSVAVSGPATEPANKGAEAKEKKDDYQLKTKMDRMKQDFDAAKEKERLRSEREKESLEDEKEKIDREIEKQAKAKEAVTARK